MEHVFLSSSGVASAEGARKEEVVPKQVVCGRPENCRYATAIEFQNQHSFSLSDSTKIL